MENCNHDSHHNDCCVCWWKQANGMEYENDRGPIGVNQSTAIPVAVLILFESSTVPL